MWPDLLPLTDRVKALWCVANLPRITTLHAMDLLPTRQALAVEGRSAPLRVTGRLREAIELMIFGTATREEAAQAVGLKDKSLRAAFAKSHVKRFIQEQKEVLRTSAGAANIRRAIELRDQNENKVAALGALRFLEEAPENTRYMQGTPQAPGCVIMISAPNGETLTIDPSRRAAETLSAEPMPDTEE